MKLRLFAFLTIFATLLSAAESYPYWTVVPLTALRPCEYCKGTGLMLPNGILDRGNSTTSRPVICTHCKGKKECVRPLTLRERLTLQKKHLATYEEHYRKAGLYAFAGTFLPKEEMLTLSTEMRVKLGHDYPSYCKSCWGLKQSSCKTCQGSGKSREKEQTHTAKGDLTDRLDITGAPIYLPCKVCNGTGAQPCQKCQGTGLLSFCRRCNGNGTILIKQKGQETPRLNLCPTCKGTGRK